MKDGALEDCSRRIPDVLWLVQALAKSVRLGLIFATMALYSKSCIEIDRMYASFQMIENS